MRIELAILLACGLAAASPPAALIRLSIRQISTSHFSSFVSAGGVQFSSPPARSICLSTLRPPRYGAIRISPSMSSG